MKGPRNVYDPKQRSYRVAFAIATIKAIPDRVYSHEGSRKFDTCFEMGDGEAVTARIYRRALKDPELMRKLPKALNVDECRRCYEAEFKCEVRHDPADGQRVILQTLPKGAKWGYRLERAGKIWEPPDLFDTWEAALAMARESFDVNELRDLPWRATT